MIDPEHDSIIKFEWYIFKKAKEFFGLKKSLLFLLGLPSVLISKRNRSAYKKMGICKNEVRGLNFVWKHPDVRFIDEIIYFNCYIPSKDFQIKENFVVIDAGANVGVFTVLAAKLAPNGKIFAIEPDKHDFKRLEENVRENRLANVININTAITDGNLDEVFFSDAHVVEETKQDSSNYIYSGKIKSISIPEIIEKYKLKKVDFLKLDIEGMEYEIFKNEDWLEKIQRIVMEIHSNSLNEQERLLNILKKHNFKTMTKKENHTLYYFAQKS